MSIDLMERTTHSPTTAETEPTVSVHPLTADLAPQLVSDWQTLFGRDAEAYALQHPHFVRTECRSLTASRLDPLLLAYRRDEELLGAAILVPKAIRTSKAGGIGPGWTLNGYRLAGSRFLSAESGPDVESRLFDAALAAVDTGHADFLLIEDLDQASTLWSRVGSELPRGWSLFAPNGYQARLRIQVPADGTDYWSQQFSSKTRSTFRRKMKKFGTTRLERISRADQVSAFLTQAHEISLQTWQSRHLGLRIRNDDGERAALTALADSSLLRSYLWYSNDEPAAFCVGNQAHGVFHYEEVGYATKFARFSPGQMLVVQMIEDLLAYDRPQTFDFGGGDADYKRMFANQTSTSGTVWVTPPSLKARASLGWIHLCRGLKQTARRAVSQLGLATRVRQWIRYGGQNVGAAPAEGAASDAPDEETSS